MKKTIYFIALSLILSACNSIGVDKISGNGDIQSETIDVDPFKDILSSGDFKVTLIQDTLWQVDVKGESNLIALLEIETNGTKLEVKPKKGYSFRQNYPIELIIHHNGIQGYTHSGAGSIDLGELNTDLLGVGISGSVVISGHIKADVVSFTISGTGTINTNLETDEMGVDISGTGDCVFAGNSDIGSFYVSGTADVMASELALKKADIRVSGSASMLLNVSEHIDAKISGVGHIEYYGDATVNSNISGLGYVRHKE